MSKPARIIIDRGIPEIIGEDEVLIIDLDFPEIMDADDLKAEVDRLETARKHDFPDWVQQRIIDWCQDKLEVVEDEELREKLRARING